MRARLTLALASFVALGGATLAQFGARPSALEYKVFFESAASPQELALLVNPANAQLSAYLKPTLLPGVDARTAGELEASLTALYPTGLQRLAPTEDVRWSWRPDLGWSQVRRQVTDFNVQNGVPGGTSVCVERLERVEGRHAVPVMGRSLHVVQEKQSAATSSPTALAELAELRAALSSTGKLRGKHLQDALKETYGDAVGARSRALGYVARWCEDIQEIKIICKENQGWKVQLPTAGAVDVTLSVGTVLGIQ